MAANWRRPKIPRIRFSKTLAIVSCSVTVRPVPIKCGPNVGRGATAGEDWPVQLTHGVIMDLNQFEIPWRVATSMEHFSAMGWPMHEPLTNSFGLSPLKSIVEGLSVRSRKILTGNSMHLVTQGAFMTYVLSNVVRIDRVEQVSNFGSLSSWDSLEDQFDEE